MTLHAPDNWSAPTMSHGLSKRVKAHLRQHFAEHHARLKRLEEASAEATSATAPIARTGSIAMKTFAKCTLVALALPIFAIGLATTAGVVALKTGYIDMEQALEGVAWVSSKVDVIFGGSGGLIAALRGLRATWPLVRSGLRSGLESLLTEPASR